MGPSSWFAMTERTAPKNILITGASSGIGAALAEEYAAPGVSLALVGRDHTRLEAVAGRCRNLGADVVCGTIDVRDTALLQAWISHQDQVRPLDLVIANAGVASTQNRDKPAESWSDITRVLDTNVYGTFATLFPAVEAMRCRGRGQLAIMSSLGAYVGMAISPAYNASKAALKIYGEGLRGWLAPQGIGVTVICPGFVQSAMSDAYPGPRPFRIDAGRAARIIRRGLARDRARIAFPLPLAMVMWFLALLPPAASQALQRWFRFA